MLFRTLSAAVYGIDADLVDIEVDITPARGESDSNHQSPSSVCPTQRFANRVNVFEPPFKTALSFFPSIAPR